MPKCEGSWSIKPGPPSSSPATASAWRATATSRLITRGGYNWADRHPWIVEVLTLIMPPPG